jgi:hypothetical protein
MKRDIKERIKSIARMKPPRVSEFHNELYKEVNDREHYRLFNMEGLSSEKQIYYIEEEIQVRLKITKVEIFKIGELLVIGKYLCQQNKIGFQKWIEENFDFSLKTANNFMNVYKQLMGFEDLAKEVPSSLLYKISAPSFPEDLREFLLTEGNLSKMSKGRFEEIIEKYKKEGMEAIEQDLLERNQVSLLYQRVELMRDICCMAKQSLEKARERAKFKMGGRIELFGFAHLGEEAGTINQQLYDALNWSISHLDKALNDTDEIYKKFVSNVSERL